MTARREASMGETCKRCGRDRGPFVPRPNPELCDMQDGWECRNAAAAYRRGIDEGVRLAKRAVDATACAIVGGYRIAFDWADVDAAAEKAKGDA